MGQNASAEIDRILAEHGAVLQRHKKHLVWRFKDGKTFVQSSTPSDSFSVSNNLADLKRLLSIQSEHTEGQRRVKKRTEGRDKSNDIKLETVKPKPQRVNLAELKVTLELNELREKYTSKIRQNIQLELDKEALERQLELALEQSPTMWQRFIGKVWG